MGPDLGSSLGKPKIAELGALINSLSFVITSLGTDSSSDSIGIAKLYRRFI